MFLNAIAFPLCNATDILWNRNMVSCCSLVTSVILLPTSDINSTAFSFHAPPVSIVIGANWWAFASSWYYAVLLSAARFAAADAVVAVSAMYELA